jgi:hypothetical protein
VCALKGGLLAAQGADQAVLVSVAALAAGRAVIAGRRFTPRRMRDPWRAGVVAVNQLAVCRANLMRDEQHVRGAEQLRAQEKQRQK